MRSPMATPSPSEPAPLVWPAFLDEVAGMLAASSDDDLRDRWGVLKARIMASPVPYHLRLIVAQAWDMAAGSGPDSIRILDHGCGPGSALIWLAGMGFTQIRGIDVGGDFEPQNRWARVALGRAEPAFQLYDGLALPVPDDSVDLVLSQQVLEHVPEVCYEAYYAEQARVLKVGGRSLSQVPHRLVPYDSHTRTWFLHMLPEGLARTVMPLAGRQWPDHLHLRWPWRHVAMTRRHIGPCVNHSAVRLAKLSTLEYYDGPRGLRLLVHRLCSLPGVGRLTAAVLSQFVLLETVAVRSRQQTR